MKLFNKLTKNNKKRRFIQISIYFIMLGYSLNPNAKRTHGKIDICLKIVIINGNRQILNENIGMQHTVTKTKNKIKKKLYEIYIVLHAFKWIIAVQCTHTFIFSYLECLFSLHIYSEIYIILWRFLFFLFPQFFEEYKYANANWIWL